MSRKRKIKKKKKPQMELRREPSGVFILELKDKLNILSFNFFKSFHGYLDQVEAAALDTNDKNVALVLVGGVGQKVFSAGLDLRNIGSEIVDELVRLCHRLATFPCATVAVASGQVIAGGVFLYCGFDFRHAVRTSNTSFHLNEALKGMPIPGPLLAVFMTRVSNPLTVVRAATYAEILSLDDAHQSQLVHAIWDDPKAAVSAAIKDAERLSRLHGGHIRQIKQELFQKHHAKL